jgi:hypothetical protein
MGNYRDIIANNLIKDPKNAGTGAGSVTIKFNSPINPVYFNQYVSNKNIEPIQQFKHIHSGQTDVYLDLEEPFKIYSIPGVQKSIISKDFGPFYLEINVLDKMNKNAYIYENVTTFDNISLFWKLELVEYAFGSDLEDAKKNYLSGPKSIKYPNGYMVKLVITFDPMCQVHNLAVLENIYSENTELLQEIIDYKNKSFSDFSNVTLNKKFMISRLSYLLNKIFYVYSNENNKRNKINNEKNKSMRRIPRNPQTGFISGPSDIKTSKDDLLNKFRIFSSTTVKDDIYKQLLTSAPEPVNILDIATGVANDYNRWVKYKNKIKHINAIDSDPKQIEEAIKRFGSKNELSVSYKVLDANKLNSTIVLDTTNADIILCNYAMNQIYNNPGPGTNPGTFFTILQKFAKKGSIFAGVATDGDELIKRVQQNTVPQGVYIDLLDNDKYSFYMDLPYFQRNGRIEEFIVRKNEFINRMKAAGFEPIMVANITDIPEYKNQPGPLLDLLGLYFVFYFRKI